MSPLPASSGREGLFAMLRISEYRARAAPRSPSMRIVRASSLIARTFSLRSPRPFAPSTAFSATRSASGNRPSSRSRSASRSSSSTPTRHPFSSHPSTPHLLAAGILSRYAFSAPCASSTPPLPSVSRLATSPASAARKSSQVSYAAAIFRIAASAT